MELYENSLEISREILREERLKKEEERLKKEQRQKQLNKEFLADIRNAHVPKQIQKIQKLVDDGADKKTRTKKYGETGLIVACQNTNQYSKHEFNKMVEFLIDIGCDLNAQDYYGRTPLMTACQKSDFLIVKTLVNADAHLKATNNSGQTAYDYAQGYILQYLLNIQDIKKLAKSPKLLASKVIQLDYTEHPATLQYTDYYINYVLSTIIGTQEQLRNFVKNILKALKKQGFNISDDKTVDICQQKILELTEPVVLYRLMVKGVVPITEKDIENQSLKNQKIALRNALIKNKIREFKHNFDLNLNYL